MSFCLLCLKRAFRRIPSARAQHTEAATSLRNHDLLNLPFADQLFAEATQPRGRKTRQSSAKQPNPTLADLIALRPCRQSDLKPPRRYSFAEKLKWVVSQYHEGISKVSAAFTVGQLRLLNAAVGESAAAIKKLKKPDLAARLVRNTQGWSWQDPTDEVERALLKLSADSTTTVKEMPLSIKEFAILSKSLLTQQNALDVTYTIKPVAEENKAVLALSGPSANVERLTRLVDNAKKAIVTETLVLPMQQHLSQQQLRAISNLTDTYLDPIDSTTLSVTYKKDRSNASFDRAKDLVFFVTAKQIRSQMTNRIAFGAPSVDLQYASLPFLPQDKPTWLIDKGHHDLYSRYQLIDRLPTDDILFERPEIIGRPRLKLVPPFSSGEQELVLSLGYAIHPLQTLDRTGVSSIDEIALDALPSADVSFVPSCPARLLSVHPASQAQALYDYDQADHIRARMDAYSISASVFRKCTYLPLRAGATDFIEVQASLNDMRPQWTALRVNSQCTTVCMPSLSMDAQLEARSAVAVPIDAINSPPSTKFDAEQVVTTTSAVPNAVELGGHSYVLAEDLHTRQCRVTEKQLDQTAEEVQVYIVRSVDRLLRGHKATTLQLRSPSSSEASSLKLLVSTHQLLTHHKS